MHIMLCKINFIFISYALLESYRDILKYAMAGLPSCVDTECFGGKGWADSSKVDDFDVLDKVFFG
jgi:hypothetical protein